ASPCRTAPLSSCMCATPSHTYLLLLIPPSTSFLLSSSAPPPPLHSFPTRRSSDLTPTGSSKRCWSGRRSCGARSATAWPSPTRADRKSTRLNSSHGSISYAVFCLKKKKKRHIPPEEICESDDHQAVSREVVRQTPA